MSVKKPKNLKPAKAPEKDVERLKQLIFNAPNEQQRKMWQKVLDKVEGTK